MTLVYLVAGEQSGDALGGRLIAALRAERPDLEFAGIGGPRMEEQGLSPLFPMRELAVMGLLEILPKILHLRRLLQSAVADVRARRPSVLVTIDSPGFTLRLLRQLSGAGIPRVHYVAPQVWAWHASRAKNFPGLWERLLCLLPFEPEFFARYGLPAHFVGHPVLESGVDTGDAARFRAAHRVAPGMRPLILMPGSRRSEVGRLLPVFGATVDLLRRDLPDILPVMPVASAVAEQVRAHAAAWARPPLIVSELSDKHDAFAAAAAALTKSGTSTLELALAGVPMAVTYRINPITSAIAERMLQVEHAAMVNLLAGRTVVPELLQRHGTPERLAEALKPLLLDEQAAFDQRSAFRRIAACLAPPHGTPSQAAAHAVLQVIDGARDQALGSSPTSRSSTSSGRNGLL